MSFPLLSAGDLDPWSDGDYGSDIRIILTSCLTDSTLSDVNIHWTRVTPAGLRQAGIKLNCKTPRAKELDKYWSFFKFNIGYEDIIASGEVIPVKVAPARSGFGVSKDIKRKRSSGSLEDDENEDDGGYDIYHTDNAHPQVSGKRVRYDTAYSYGDAHSGSNSNHDSSSHDSTFNNYIYEYNPEDQGYPPLYPHDEPIPAHSITNVGMHTRLTRLENAVANVQHEVYKLNDLFVQQKNLERENQELKAQVDYLKAREAELMECVVRAEEAVSFARRVVRGKNW